MPRYKNGSGTVYRRGKTWWLAYYTPDGKQHWESAKTENRAEAKRKLNAKMGEIAEGRHIGPDAERVTFDDIAEMLLIDYRVNGKKTLQDTRARVEKHLRRFFGGRKAHEITTADVQFFIAKRQTEGATNAEINREIAALKRAFNLALQAGRITKKPYMQRLEEKNVRQGFFEAWQFDALLPKLPDYLRPPMTFAYWTGWRVYSEVLSLTWSQIDLDAGTVRLLPGSTKNGDGRVLFLAPELRAVVEQQWAEHRTLYSHCPLVFHRGGKEIKDLRGAWKRACQESGLVGKIPHDFRRTAIRNMVRAGISEHVAMRMSGHRTRDVFDRYDIVSESDLKEAAQKLSERLSGRRMTKMMTPAPSDTQQSMLSH